jgi:pimeloyl-ACP methyl ester carboxylesterase
VSERGISYHRCGSGPCLVLIHGVGLRAESWYPYIEPLSPHFELIIPDLPGHGDSSHLAIPYQQATLTDYSQSMSEFVTQATQQPFYLCGHSLGSLIAIELAAELSVKVLGMAALNAILERSDTAQHAVQLRAKVLRDSESIVGVSHTIDRWFGETPKGDQQEFALLCKHWLTSCDLDGYAMAYKAFADQQGPAKQTLNAITCPSRYMTGRLDQNSSPEMTLQLTELSGQSKAVVIEAAGHMMPLTHAEDVIRELLELKSLNTQQA